MSSASAGPHSRASLRSAAAAAEPASVPAPAPASATDVQAPALTPIGAHARTKAEGEAHTHTQAEAPCVLGALDPDARAQLEAALVSELQPLHDARVSLPTLALLPAFRVRLEQARAWDESATPEQRRAGRDAAVAPLSFADATQSGGQTKARELEPPPLPNDMQACSHWEVAIAVMPETQPSCAPASASASAGASVSGPEVCTWPQLPPPSGPLPPRELPDDTPEDRAVESAKLGFWTGLWAEWRQFKADPKSEAQHAAIEQQNRAAVDTVVEQCKRACSQPQGDSESATQAGALLSLLSAQSASEHPGALAAPTAAGPWAAGPSPPPAPVLVGLGRGLRPNFVAQSLAQRVRAAGGLLGSRRFNLLNTLLQLGPNLATLFAAIITLFVALAVAMPARAQETDAYTTFLVSYTLLFPLVAAIILIRSTLETQLRIDLYYRLLDRGHVLLFERNSVRDLLRSRYFWFHVVSAGVLSWCIYAFSMQVGGVTVGLQVLSVLLYYVSMYNLSEQVCSFSSYVTFGGVGGARRQLVLLAGSAMFVKQKQLENDINGLLWMAQSLQCMLAPDKSRRSCGSSNSSLQEPEANWTSLYAALGLCRDPSALGFLGFPSLSRSGKLGVTVTQKASQAERRAVWSKVQQIKKLTLRFQAEAQAQVQAQAQAQTQTQQAQARAVSGSELPSACGAASCPPAPVYPCLESASLRSSLASLHASLLCDLHVLSSRLVFCRWAGALPLLLGPQWAFHGATQLLLPTPREARLATSLKRVLLLAMLSVIAVEAYGLYKLTTRHSDCSLATYDEAQNICVMPEF